MVRSSFLVRLFHPLLSTGFDRRFRDVPAPNTNFVAIAAGSLHSVGLKADGSVVAWGHTDYGQCQLPVPNAGFTAIAAGGNRSLAIRGYIADINDDMHVDVSDLQQLVTCWGLAKTDAGYDADADINGDGYINIGDLQLLVQNWGK